MDQSLPTVVLRHMVHLPVEVPVGLVVAKPSSLEDIPLIGLSIFVIVDGNTIIGAKYTKETEDGE
jgi:hypothetical protein